MKDLPPFSLVQTITGPQLKARREALRLTQRHLAQLLGTSQAKISYWERGQLSIPTAGAVRLALERLEQIDRDLQRERIWEQRIQSLGQAQDLHCSPV